MTSPSPASSSHWGDDGWHSRTLPAPASASKPSGTSSMCARESLQQHGETKGTSAGSLSMAILPFPAGLAGSESAVSTAGLPERPSIWEEGGSRSHIPRGRELRRPAGCARQQAQSPSCSAPLSYASVWPGWGSQARLGAKGCTGTAEQPAPTGRVGLGVPPPWGETCPSQHPKLCTQRRGWGSPQRAQPV